MLVHHNCNRNHCHDRVDSLITVVMSTHDIIVLCIRENLHANMVMALPQIETELLCLWHFYITFLNCVKKKNITFLKFLLPTDNQTSIVHHFLFAISLHLYSNNQVLWMSSHIQRGDWHKVGKARQIDILSSLNENQKKFSNQEWYVLFGKSDMHVWHSDVPTKINQGLSLYLALVVIYRRTCTQNV